MIQHLLGPEETKIQQVCLFARHNVQHSNPRGGEIFRTRPDRLGPGAQPAYSTKKNSVALVRERTPERPPPVGEVSANFSG